ncbi:MAG: DNA-binding protein WhiA [Lachnospiraceae bacterium]|nr:DNA-binding protein WhiA [Lachnospiraceae bacterium]
MSFSRKVKEELSHSKTASRHCQIAELAGIIGMCGRIKISEDNKYQIYVHTENIMVARKYQYLVTQLYDVNIDTVVRNSRQKKSNLYTVVVKDPTIARKILQSVKLLDMNGIDIIEDLSTIYNTIIRNSCCKRAFLRGVFLATGSVSDPSKAYHFEITSITEEKAQQIKEIIGFFGIDAKVILRKKYYVVYVKEGSQIVDLFNIMEAHVALMEFENVRILKEMRNSINRKVNCETANINKTVNAASRQIEDIMYIKNTVGFGELSESLEEVARVRIEHPDLSLKDLGEILSKPIGKSGVNHRLKKLSSIAQNIREQNKEDILK